MGEISLENVSKVFAGDVIAVNDVSLQIADGEFIVLVGPSGCGKTTLLRMIGGLESLSDGRIVIGGRDVTKVAPGDRDLAMVFQNYALYPHMSVRENLGYSLKVHKVPKQEIARRVERVAELLGLTELLDRRPRALSGGQQQRVAMGRAIVREPAAFLMDEPLSNLDAKLRVAMRTSLQELHHRLRTTTVYVTHDQVEAMTLGERVAVMSEGKIQQVDSPQHLYREPANVFVAAFIGSPAMNLARAAISGDELLIGQHRIPLDPERRPDVRDGEVVVGIRPEAFEDAAYSQPGAPQLEVVVRVVEELGAETHVFFDVDAEKVVVEAAQAESSDEEEAALLAGGRDKALFTARVDPRGEPKVGGRFRLAVDPARLYFFSPSTGESLVDRPAALSA